VATIFAKVLEEVRPGMVLGLGSGRASQGFIRALAGLVARGLDIRGVPTSVSTQALATELRIPLVGLEQVGAQIDMTVDGADEVDPELNMIKGYGRALVREKIIASASRRLVILIGMKKLVNRLGDRGKLPVEVIPFALPLVLKELAAMGIAAEVWMQGHEPALSDNGNCILDCQTEGADDVIELAGRIRAIPGVVDTGIFQGLASEVLVGDEDRDFAHCQTLERPASDQT